MPCSVAVAKGRAYLYACAWSFNRLAPFRMASPSTDLAVSVTVTSDPGTVFLESAIAKIAKHYISSSSLLLNKCIRRVWSAGHRRRTRAHQISCRLHPRSFLRRPGRSRGRETRLQGRGAATERRIQDPGRAQCAGVHDGYREEARSRGAFFRQSWSGGRVCSPTAWRRSARRWALLAGPNEEVSVSGRPAGDLMGAAMAALCPQSCPGARRSARGRP